jgi:hypothetical protein
MTSLEKARRDFAQFAAKLKGDEKGEAPTTLDAALRGAHGIKETEGSLAVLLKFNPELAANKSKGQAITPPGLPAFISSRRDCTTTDYVEPPQRSGHHN